MEEKKWYQSLTIAGLAIMTLCSVVLPLTGASNYAAVLESEKSNIADWLTLVGQVIGTLLAIIGRFRAAKKVTV